MMPVSGAENGFRVTTYISYRQILTFTLKEGKNYGCIN